ncbi:MAG: hypothetical protein PHF21_02275 [Bacilli bacterium]|nr:hypothetical protein [Bacilli bacterium]
MKKNKKKFSFGFITLGVSILFLCSTLFLYKYAKIDDVFSVVLMTFSIIIGIYGLFQIIKDAYN